MSECIEIDPYVTDELMRDLVGAARSPSAYLVYLWLWRSSHGAGIGRVGISLQGLADATGLSKSAVQAAIRRLRDGRLITSRRSGPTDAPIYCVHQPWLGRGRGGNPGYPRCSR